jgi:hypothetical protein
MVQATYSIQDYLRQMATFALAASKQSMQLSVTRGITAADLAGLCVTLRMLESAVQQQSLLNPTDAAMWKQACTDAAKHINGR